MSLRLGPQVILVCLILFAMPSAGNEPARQANTDKSIEAAQTRVDSHGDPLPPGAIQRLGSIRFRPGGQVNALAISPDGKWISAGTMGAIRIFDASTGRPSHTLSGHKSQVFSVAFSPDGKRLVSAGSEEVQTHPGSGKLIIWDVETERALVTVNHRGWIRCAAFAADGSRVAMCSNDGTLRLLDAATGEVQHSLGKPRRFTNTVAFSPDGKFLAGPGDEGAILLWDVATGKEHLQLAGVGKPARTLAFTPDGKSLATSHDGSDFMKGEGLICLWDLMTGQKRATLEGHKGAIFSLAFSPDGKRLASGGLQGNIFLWDVSSGKQLRTLNDGQGWMHAVLFSPDGRTLITGGTNGLIRLWDPETGKERDGHAPGLGLISVAADGKTVAAAGGVEPIRLWEVASGRPLATLPSQGQVVYSLAFAPGAARLASGGKDGAIHLWSLTRNQEEYVSKLPGASFHSSVAFSPSGKLLAASQVSAIRLLDPAMGREIRQLEGHDGYVIAMSFSPDEKLLASAAHTYRDKSEKQHEDHSVRIWDVTRGEQLHVFRSVTAIHPTFCPDGRTLAYVSQWRMVCRDIVTGQEQPTPADTEVSAFAYSPDGSWLATADLKGPIRVYERRTSRQVLSFNVSAAVRQLFWTKDGKRLISGNGDATALVWDLSPQGWSWSSRHDGLEGVQRCWSELKSPNAAEAYRALWDLAAQGNAAVAFLEKRLQPVGKEGVPEEIRQGIADLDDDQFAVRDAASQRLIQLALEAEPALREALAGSPSPELRTRVAALLRQLKNIDPPLNADETQFARALIVLERIDTAQSRRLLERLAAGAPCARRTLAAKRALDRLTRPLGTAEVRPPD